MLENLMDTTAQYLDTAMVGSLGTAATAAVGCTTTVNWLIGSSIAAMGVGFLSYISKALGAGDRDRAGKAALQGILMAGILGIFFTVLTQVLAPFIPVWMRADSNIQASASRYFAILYSTVFFRGVKIIFGTMLRAAGDSRTPMRTGIGMNLVNLVLNFLFIYPSRTVTLGSLSLRIFGAGWGISGAALASALSFAYGGIAITFALFQHPILSPKGRSLRLDRGILIPCLQIAVPNMLQRFCTSLGYVIFASMINSLGELSTASHTIANTVEAAFYIPGYGMQAAVATLTGNCIGAKDGKRLREISSVASFLEFGMMFVSGGLLFLFAPALVGLFSKDPEVISLGGLLLRMVSVSEPFYGLSIITEGMLQGAGLTKVPFLFNVLCMWGFRIGGTAICLHFLHLGLPAAWVCMLLNNMSLLLFFRIYWNKKKRSVCE